ncbi:MAG: CRISPR-associated endonuclease Cas2 [Patescibacteria group bacterium]
MEGKGKQTNLNLEKINWEQTTKIFALEKASYLERINKGLDRYPGSREILGILAGLGVVGLAVLMPGLVKVLASQVRAAERQRYQRLWKSLAKRKLVEISEEKGVTTVKITEDGLKTALKYKLSEVRVKKPKNWDGQFRLVIFDVPEKKKASRDHFRQSLKGAGFYMLNKSVFVHPYPCFDEVEFLRQVHNVGGEVTFAIASQIESAKDLKRYFDL